MPQITAIKPQQKLKDRCSLFVDGKFLMGVDGSLVLKYDLKVGNELTDSLKLDLENADRIELAYTGLLNFISFRERCEHEVHEWLYKKGFVDLEEELVQRLKSRNYLDDARFARLFVRDRVKLKSWGPLRLRNELRSKRISDAIIENALEEINSEYDFQELAIDILQRKLKNMAHPTYKDKSRLFNLLQRRGYPTPLIMSALSEIQFHNDTEDFD